MSKSVRKAYRLRGKTIQQNLLTLNVTTGVYVGCWNALNEVSGPVRSQDAHLYSELRVGHQF